MNGCISTVMEDTCVLDSQHVPRLHLGALNRWASSEHPTRHAHPCRPLSHCNNNNNSKSKGREGPQGPDIGLGHVSLPPAALGSWP